MSLVILPLDRGIWTASLDFWLADTNQYKQAMWCLLRNW